MQLNNTLKLIVAVVISELAGVFGAVFTIPSVENWYVELAKPAFNPPAWVFGPVWTTLYLLIGVALYLVWRRDFRVTNLIIEKNDKAWNPWSERFWRGDLQKENVIAIFAVQYILNVGWSLVFFGQHQPGLAFFVLLALWFSILYTIVNFYRISKLAAWLLIPYILWVSFAVVLNFSIWQLVINN